MNDLYQNRFRKNDAARRAREDSERSNALEEHEAKRVQQRHGWLTHNRRGDGVGSTTLPESGHITRLINAFSKKLDNLKAPIALHFAHYNFVRVHQTLRTTPAMAANHHLWS